MTPTPRRSVWAEVAALAGLAVVALAALWPLGLTNRILAGIDALTYFTPYWAYRMAALRAGQAPLWNPHIFLGAPFLANIQAAVLYPLHWPLSWLAPERALVWSAILHVWLGAALTYALARRSLGLTRAAGFLAGCVFALGGFTLARVENINQLNALAWLPGLLWLADEAAGAAGRRARLRWGLALTAVIALQFLAGHTQTTFINMAALALYVLFPAAVGLWRERRMDWRRASVLLAAAPALALSAAQLLPALELSALGWRGEGLPFRQAASFSLQPRLLLQSLLPPYGGGLAATFGSEGYAEFIGYIGIAALLLGMIGLGAAWRQTRRGDGRGVRALGLALLALIGLFLALGAYNPVYYLLWRFAPGFDLFRAPVRWLALYAIGMAGLAGMGLDALRAGIEGAPAWPAGRRRRVLLVAAAIGLIALGIVQHWPDWPTLVGWLAVAALAAGLIWAAQRVPRLAVGALVALALAELALGSRALPYTLATAPMALDLRNAPAALLAAEDGPPAGRPAGRDRFLSLSDIRYDPGDLAELRALQADRLPPEAVDRMVRAAKLMEVIAPNLSLWLELPAADGYDGGLLPTEDYVNLTALFLPDAARLPDGRLREQLRQTPGSRLLDLIGVRYVVTDKQHDLWADDIYYDLEHPAVIQPGETLRLDLARQGAPFSATGVGIVSHLDAPATEGAPAAEVVVEAAGGVFGEFLTVGRDTDWSQAAETGARVARAWPDWMGDGRDFLARVALPAPAIPTAIEVRVPEDAPGALVLRGMSLIDGRTSAHASVTVSQEGDLRRMHTGDVKVYERLDAPGRAWLAHGITPARDREAALAQIADPDFDPRAAVILEGDVPARPPAPAGSRETVEALEMTPERQVYRVSAESTAALVVADAYYPGWQVTVDGIPAQLERANGMFRAVLLDGGLHSVVFEYRPESWRRGAAISVVALIAFAALALASILTRRDPQFQA